MNHRIGRKASFGVFATFASALTLGAVAEAAGPAPHLEEVVEAQLALTSADATAGSGDTVVLDDNRVVAQLRMLGDERDEARRQALIDDLIVAVLQELATTTTTAAPTTAPPTTAPPTTAPPAPAPPPTTAPPAPAPVPTGSSALDAIAAWFPDVYDQAVRVADCESSLNPGAVSAGGGNHGLFQLNNVHAGAFASVTGQPWTARYDAYHNAHFARYLFDQAGWGPWSCRP